MTFPKSCLSIAVCLILVSGCQPGAKKDAAKKAQDAASKLNEAAGEALDKASKAKDNLKVGSVEIGETLSYELAKLTALLNNVKDADSAKASVPSLKGFPETLDSLNHLTGGLTGPAKTAFGTLVKDGTVPIKEKINEVLEKPGVSDVLRPVLDEIVEKLSTLAGQ